MMKIFHASQKNNHTANCKRNRDDQVDNNGVTCGIFFHYRDEITSPVLVTTKETNYNEDDVKKIGCNG